jgi:hypothetical protein
MNRRFWMRAAWRTAARLNLAAWLEKFLPVGLAVAGLFSVTLLALRRGGIAQDGVWLFFYGMLGAAALLAVALARRKFFTREAALVRLDAVLLLHNRLSSAAAGVGEWPNPAEPIEDGFRWNQRRIVFPIALGALAVCGAAWLPIQPDAGGVHRIEAPPAWTELEAWADRLAESALVEQPAIEKLREEIAALRQQPQDEWYSHSSLEAGDTLREETEQALRALSRELSTSAAALSTLESLGEKANAEQLKAFGELLNKAKAGLQSGTLPLNPELAKKLESLNAATVRQLTPEQIAALRKQLEKGAGVCKQCLGGDGTDSEMETLVEAIRDARAAAGGKGGGGGPAPLPLKDNPTELGSNKTETISNKDLTDASPGEVLGTSAGSHEVDPATFSGPTAGGSIAAPGAGGEAVWRDVLTPAERAVLQRFYK